MEKNQLDRSLARNLVLRLAPQYTEMLRDLQSRDHGAKLNGKLEDMLRRMNMHNYVLLYDNENSIGIAFLLFLLGEEGLKEFNADFSKLNPEEQMQAYTEMLEKAQEEDTWSWVDDLFPDTPEKEAAARQAYDALSDDEKREHAKRAGFFWSSFYASFYNYLSVMLTGQKLTELVALAKQGDEAAFGKALQVDPRLLAHHPYFQQRHRQAIEEGEANFLKRVGYRLANPGPRGQIRYPGLYMVFAILDVLGWLDGGMTHNEILDLCDEAGLDPYQNRIEDVTSLTKRLGEYRKMQKQARLSML